MISGWQSVAALRSLGKRMRPVPWAIQHCSQYNNNVTSPRDDGGLGTIV